MTHSRFVLHVLASLGLVLIALSPTMMAVPTSVQAQVSPSITIVKQTNPAGGTGFDFTGTGGLGSFSLDDDGSQMFDNLPVGDYDVTETVPDGWELTGIVCIGGDSTDITDGVTVHLGPGEDITCTFTNEELGSITIVKETDPAGGTGFDFTGDLGGFTLNDGGSRPSGNLISGDYTVTETVPTGWDLTGVVCTGGDSDSITDGVTIHLEPGEDITCTFTNEELTCPVGMISYWKLDETSGTTYDDYYNGNDGDGSVSPPTPSTDGVVGGSQDFNGTSDFITVADDPSLDWASDASFTIELWAKLSNVSLKNKVMIGRDQIGGTHWWLGAKKDSGTAHFNLTATDGSGGSITGYTPMNDGQWHHIVAVKDGSTNQNRLYVDGIEESSKTYTYTAGFDATTTLGIGYMAYHGTPDFYYDGLLDEIASYSVTLSKVEIQQHYQNGLAELGHCASIAITKEADQTVVNGSYVTFTISVTNTGVLDLAHVTVTDAPVPDCDADLGGLDAGHSASYTCTVFNVMDTFTNSATVTGTTFAGVKVTATASVDLTHAEGIQYLPIILKNFNQ